MIRLLFVCHGNICRSTMAQYLFQDLAVKKGYSVTENKEEYCDFFLDSAATSREEIGNDVDLRTRSKLKEHGIYCGHHYARQVTKTDYDWFDLILIMDRENEWGIRRILPADPDDKIHMILEYASGSEYRDKNGNVRDVADPWYTHNFELTYQDLLAGCRGLLNFLSDKKAGSDRTL